MLGNSDEHRLVVSGRVDGSHTVEASGKTARDVGGDGTVLLSGVNTLEEHKLRAVKGSGLCERLELLDDDVRVADDVALGVHLLGSRVVVRGGVHEVAGLKVVQRHRDGEVGVGGNRVEVLRALELGGGNVRCRGDDTCYIPSSEK